MAKKARLPNALYQYDFAQLARKERHARTRLRWLGLAHVQAGKSYQEVAEALKVNEKSVTHWVKRLAEGGLKGVREKPGRGAKRRIPANLEETLKAALLIHQVERQGERLTGREIQQLLADQFGIQCSLTTVYQTLRRIGWAQEAEEPRYPVRPTEPEAGQGFRNVSRRQRAVLANGPDAGPRKRQGSSS